MLYVRLEVSRTAYSPDQIKRTMTVGELIEELQQYDEDAPVMFSNDNGYTFGSINYGDIMEDEYEDECEEE